MNLTCPVCQNSIRAEDINMQALAAKCSSCHNVFGFGDKFARSASRKFPVEMPKQVRIAEDNLDLLILRKWFSPAAFVMVFFCVFWDGFLVFWYMNALKGPGSLVFSLFPLIHVGVGVFLTYMTVATFLNTTTIRISPTSLEVRHGPLPWPGVKPIPREQFDQFYCKEHVHRGKKKDHVFLSTSCGSKRRKNVKLLSVGNSNPEEVIFMEQKIEAHLGIRDREVTDEYRKV